MDARLEKLYAKRTFGIKPGLIVISKLMEELGNPQNKLRTIHIAGTNGKGSVTAMLMSALRELGLNIGVYTSPHLVNVNERFSINGKNISDSEFFDLLERVEIASETLKQRDGLDVTFFEYTTAVAFLWFAEKNVDLAIIEVGMGGRLDATNILPAPLVTIMTRIGLDHVAYLGDSIEQIAKEKAGIIKTGTTLVVGPNPDEALAVFSQVAREKSVFMRLAAEEISVVRQKGSSFIEQRLLVESQDCSYGIIKLKLPAAYQLENLSIVISALEALQSQLKVELPVAVLKAGLEKAEWRGRFCMLTDDILVDGAHNQDGANALVASLQSVAGKKARFVFVAGMCGDKATDCFMKAIAPICQSLYLTPINNPRSATTSELARQAHACGIRNVEECGSMLEAISVARKEETTQPIVLCGSLFLVGEAYEQFNESPCN